MEKQESKNINKEKALFGASVLALLVFFWIVTNFWVGLLLAVAGGFAWQKTKENNPEMQKFMPKILIGLVVLIFVAIFASAIQSDNVAKQEKEEVVLPENNSNKESAQKEKTATETESKKLLDVAVIDWTENNPPSPDAEIWVRGHGSWFLDLEFGGDGKELEEFPVGELRTNDFYIYPDGRDGVEIQVEFKMAEDMISGSTRNLTKVGIYDDYVEVSGAAIPDGKQKFIR